MNEISKLLEELISLIFHTFDDVNVSTEVVFRNDVLGKLRRADLLVSKLDTKLVIEVKAYKSKRTSYSLLDNALSQLANLVNYSRSSGGILIVTSNIDSQFKLSLEESFNLKIWDRGVLFYLTSKYPELRQKLETILLQLLESGEEDIYQGANIPLDLNVDSIWHRQGFSYRATISVVGSELCRELSAIPPGLTSAYLFEKKCEEIVKYLFADDLTLWERQSPTDDTLHKFDLIAKIASKNDFWRLLARDFKSRFVIFEFKNYTERIKQGQIYSTEKYLYLTALRTIAIVLSREGADANAITAMNGSLREQGKLIICLDQRELCKLLALKDNGDDPNSYLSEKIDKLLMKLSR